MTMQGDDLKAARKGVGMSQADLADAIGMSRETVGAMERGQAPIERRTELAVLYVTGQAALPINRAPNPTPYSVAAAITGQGQAATMNLDEIIAAMLPHLDRRYVRQ